jgi:hypothetical protein
MIIRNDITGPWRGPRLASEKGIKEMKLTNFLGETNRSFASVFLAFSLFGFLFPHHANQVQANPNHRVNLTTTEQATEPEPADDGSVYEWFY